jgi:hypothetical protein
VSSASTNTTASTDTDDHALTQSEISTAVWRFSQCVANCIGDTSLLPFRLFIFKGTVSSLNCLVRVIGSTGVTRIQQVEIGIEMPCLSIYASGDLFWNSGAS